MYEDILREVGLSTNEAKIYETLVRLKEAPVEVLAVKSKVHRRNIYDSVAKLIEKGLVSEAFVEGKKFYRAISPSRLLDIAREKEAKVGSIVPELEKQYNRQVAEERAYIYKGVEGFKSYLNDIIEVGEDGYYLAAKGGWFDERIRAFLPGFFAKSEKLGLKHYTLFDYEVKEEMPEIFKSPGFRYKMLPKGYSTDSAADVFGDHVVTFTGLHIGRLDDDLTQFVVVSRGLADSYKVWFRYIWDSLPGGKFPKV